MTDRVPLVVIGAGPAGIAAALEADRHGAPVRVLDENALPGGQYLRQLNPRFTAREPHGKASDRALLDDLARSGITVETGTVAWGVFPDRAVGCFDGRRTFQIAADCLILAPGAYDRPVPIPGWTLPGVFTAGGALNLLKQHRMLPGRRVVLSGVGPLQLVLAAELAGARVVTVCDPASTLDSVRALPDLLLTPQRLLDGLRTLQRLRAAGVPIARRRAVIRVLGKERVEGVVSAAVDSSWRVVRGTEREVAADAVCLGYGFVPSVELAELAGAPLYFDSGCQWWVPARSAEMETGAASVFAAGDGAGIGGAPTARAEGAIAGLAAAERLGYARGSDAAARLASLQRTWRRLQRSRASLERLFGLRPGAETWATDDTVICRCEEVRLGAIREAISDGARRLAEIKGRTRCGMGRCQGRMCGPFLARYVSTATGAPIEAAGRFRARPPVKPVPLEALLDVNA